jgi:hypothetical protein
LISGLTRLIHGKDPLKVKLTDHSGSSACDFQMFVPIWVVAAEKSLSLNRSGEIARRPVFLNSLVLTCFIATSFIYINVNRRVVAEMRFK